MKYCVKCGQEIDDNSSYCPKCGAKQEVIVAKESSNNNTLRLIAFIFAILSCCGLGLLLFPLAWLIPMTVHTYHLYTRNQKPSLGFAICSLLFVSIVSGILLIVDYAEKDY